VSSQLCRPYSQRPWSRLACKILALAQGRSRAWTSETYGGGATLPCWGIDSIASTWIAAAIGSVHRSQPVPDLEDMAVVFVLALMTPDTQHTYMREFDRFRPGSLRLDRIIEQLASEIGAALPEVIAQFLTACKETGVPR
jgi:hypothetical protein